MITKLKIIKIYHIPDKYLNLCYYLVWLMVGQVVGKDLI